MIRWQLGGLACASLLIFGLSTINPTLNNLVAIVLDIIMYGIGYCLGQDMYERKEYRRVVRELQNERPDSRSDA